MKRGPDWLISIVFWLHLPIVIIWFGAFAVPLSVWPERIVFHFWFIAGIMAIQLLWGVLAVGKFDIICPITSYMQWLRGYPLTHKKSYGHSYIAELFNILGIKMHYKWVNYLLLITLAIVCYQYWML